MLFSGFIILHCSTPDIFNVFNFPNTSSQPFIYSNIHIQTHLIRLLNVTKKRVGLTEATFLLEAVKALGEKAVDTPADTAITRMERLLVNFIVIFI
jgi:hypothetical protein